MKHYKAAIHRRGATTQFMYGNNLSGLISKATKALNKPLFSTTPEKIVLYARTFANDAARPGTLTWTLIRTIPA